MFTGLVETVGTVVDAVGASPRRLSISSSIDAASVPVGASVAIDGCCLTVVERQRGALVFEAATETLARTTLGRLVAGDAVNLEQALRVGDRLGGHLVTGHVDGLAVVREIEQRGSATYVGLEAPPELAGFIASQGSVTTAGVSLTVTSVRGRCFWVGLIPHTLSVTTLGRLVVGAQVNLEVDLIARYVARLMEPRLDGLDAPK